MEKIFAIAHFADQAVLIILLIMSVVSVAMILERFFVLRKVAQESAKIRAKVKTALQSNALKDFEDLAKDTTCLEGRAAAHALKHYQTNGREGFEEIFNSYVLTEKPELEKFLPVLATISSNAPFIGLFGTVLGIMKAFNDLATSANAGQQTVMAGISIALVATAAGLFVAIPASMCFNYFTRKVRAILSSLDSVRELGVAFAKGKK